MALDSNLNLGMNKYILHIETATKVCSVALSNCGEFIACKESISDGFIHSEALTLYIEEVLAEGKVTLSDLCAISISSGPGSYTGLRIGLSTAKGLCFALKIPLISVDTLSALMELVPLRNQNIIPLLDARRMEVYAQVFSSTGTILQAIDSIELDEKHSRSLNHFKFVETVHGNAKKYGVIEKSIGMMRLFLVRADKFNWLFINSKVNKSRT